MIGWAQLRGAARPTPPAPDLGVVAARLGGKRLVLGDVGRRAVWPASGDVALALSAAGQLLPPQQLAQLIEALLTPVRAYVLRAPSNEQRYALLGSWDGAEMVCVRVTMQPEADSGDRLALAIHELPPDAPALADQLNELFTDIDPRHAPRSDPSRRTLDRALWVGGSTGEAKRDDWEHALAALFGSRGLDVDVFARPSDSPAHQAQQRLTAFRGAMTVIWSPRAGRLDLRERLLAAAKPPLIEINDPDFEVALIETAVELDARDQDRAEELHGTGTPLPQPAATLTGGPHYFKKTGSGGGSYGDRMQIVAGPCVHNNAFKRAKRPDQAKRGIARIARAEPIKLEHCERCTGGGFWRAWFDDTP